MTNNIETEKVLIGLTTEKETDFSDWYRQILLKAEMMDYSDISGCYVIRPTSMKIWKLVQNFIDERLDKLGVQPAYFPLFTSKKALETEKSHIEGFAPEVAWVTNVGSSQLDEPIAIRATSEVIIYQQFPKWIRSHRDLPYKVNQWCNVVRWEMKDCTPFIRSREFLWSEGHTCFLTKQEADEEVLQILDLYETVYQKLLAVPVIKGTKSENEKFAGAEYTTTVECFIPTVGKGIQGATSHFLGQNFSKMFGISVETPTKEKQFVYQNSWGVTTRTLGIMIMIHSDNKGLVLPPMVAPTKVVIIPCGLTKKISQETEESIKAYCQEIARMLSDDGLATIVDDRTNYRVGHKFNYHELRGTPLRFEIGPNDWANKTVTIYRRDNGTKSSMVYDENFFYNIDALLMEIQENIFSKAKKERNNCIAICYDVTTTAHAIQEKKMCLVPWCEEVLCEQFIINNCKQTYQLNMKSLCIPFDQNLPAEIIGDPSCQIGAETLCAFCHRSAKRFALFGSSY